MPIEHKNITGVDLHEPKGVASSNSGEVYVSDGSGSGSWSPNYQEDYISIDIPDISTASSHWLVVPYNCTIDKIYSVIDGAISIADAILSFEIGGIVITDSSITITQSGSAAGDIDLSSPSALNVLTAGQAIEVITNGGSTNVVRAHITLVLQRI